MNFDGMRWEKYWEWRAQANGIDKVLNKASEAIHKQFMKEFGQKVNGMAKKDIVVFDLDGCLCDDEWRLYLIDDHDRTLPNRYEKYHSELSHDNTLSQGAAIFRMHMQNGAYPVFITARPISKADATIDWIRDHLGVAIRDARLYMRPADNTQSSPELKGMIIKKFLKNVHPDHFNGIIAAYDDRPDVVAVYRSLGIPAYVLDKDGVQPAMIESEGNEAKPVSATGALLGESLGFDGFPKNAADILNDAATTFAERNAAYKDNAVNVGAAMASFFPNGVRLKTKEDHHIYHLFELIVVKLTRFANSNLHHVDSIHDAMVYAAMVELLTDKHNINP